MSSPKASGPDSHTLATDQWLCGGSPGGFQRENQRRATSHSLQLQGRVSTTGRGGAARQCPRLWPVRTPLPPNLQETPPTKSKSHAIHRQARSLEFTHIALSTTSIPKTAVTTANKQMVINRVISQRKPDTERLVSSP